MYPLPRWKSPPLWLIVFFGALPVGLSMLAVSLPDGAAPYERRLHLLFFVGYVVCSVPLVWVQRQLRRAGSSLWVMALALIAVSYVLAVINNLNMVKIADEWGLVAGGFKWRMPLRGLGSTWMALMSFCVFQAVLTYAFELRDERERRLEASKLARDAELRALRYQLHPHFLFNTLNTISSLVANSKSREATRMISRLGDFLRATLESGEVHEVSLAHELSLTEHYLDIEKARLDDRLTVSMQIGPDALLAAVPYLLLQPLVENAIRHGIAPYPQGGHLAIEAMRQGERLHLLVRNSGAPSAALPATDTATPRPAAVGLRNVRERLARLYERDHVMTFDLTDQGHCLVRIELPYRPLATLPETKAA